MICAICGREGRGFCWVAPKGGPHTPSDQRLFKRFCSRPCQDIYLKRSQAGAGTVIDPTHNERTAMAAVLPRLGEFVADVGLDRPLSAYTREEVLQLIDVVLTAYFESLRDLTPDDVPF